MTTNFDMTGIDVIIETATHRCSDRITRLRAVYKDRYAALTAGAPSGLYYDPEERAVFSRSVLRAYRETIGQPVIQRRVRVLECFAENVLIRSNHDDLLSGSQMFCSFGFAPEDHEEIHRLGYARNPGHIIHHYAGLLEAGVEGLLESIRARRQRPTDDREILVLDAFERGLLAFRRYIERQAQSATDLAAGLGDSRATEWAKRATSLRRLAHDRPTSFHEALQLVWFAQIFLHAENPSAAISFGRLDQYLWTFLADDLAQQRIDWPAAANLVAAFFLRCGEGEESQNLVVGGTDTDGHDATNPLSILLLRVMREMRLPQPSLSVRLHPKSPTELLDAACALAASGTGQPAFINDEAAIPGLMELGIPIERARDYGIVGCYEACPQGDCYPNTVGGAEPSLPQALVTYLNTPAAQAAPDFRAFFEGYLAHMAAAYDAVVRGAYQERWNHWRDQAPSPFGSVLMLNCIDRACPLEAGGARFSLYGVNLLGLGTAIDSLHAVEDLVFRRRTLSVAFLAAALAADLPDDTLRHSLLSVPGRYGTDSRETNALAFELSERVARMVLDSRMNQGVRPYPAFFRFTADVFDHPHATPDGRRAAEHLSYGCGPALLSGGSPTAILASAAHVAHRLCACGNPLALSLQAADVQGPEGRARIKALVMGYFATGGFHVHFNLQSADALRKAKADPAGHRDLMIRISGLSAKYVTLQERLQDALIERAEKGI